MLDTVGEAALRTALLAGVVQAALWLLRIHQARLLLAAWTIVLAASISMPLLPRFTPLSVPLDPALSRTLIDGAAELLPRPPPQPAPGTARPEALPERSIIPWLERLYAAVAGAIVLRVALGVGLSMRILARAVPIRQAWATGMRVRISPNVTGPVTIARSIVVPIDIGRWSAETRHAVLAHERSHVTRLDFALLVLSQLNRAVFWFSPVSWWLHRRLVALTELASDDHALAVTRDPLAYAEILLEMGRRSSPTPHGPAMARPATLPHRIDRILMHIAISPDLGLQTFEGRSLPLLLSAGVAALSLAVAGLVPGTVSYPAVTLMQPIDAIEQNPPSQQPTTSDGQALLTMPPIAPQTAPQTNAVPRPQPQRPTTPPPSRAANRASPKSPAPLPPRPAERPTQNTEGHAITPPQTPVVQPAGRTTALPDDETRWPLPQQIVFAAPTPASPDIEAVVGRTCTGILAVGPAVWTSSYTNQPNVVAGQHIPIQAQFFRKQNGAAWVRFHAFQRPPLDLPLRPSRNGIAWTGEYGISYTVQNTTADRLVGLAARVANDSARLEFTCQKSATHLF